MIRSRLLRIGLLVGVVGALGIVRASGAEAAPPCALEASGEHMGILVNGICVEDAAGANGGPATPQPSYRYVGCLSNGTAVWDGQIQADAPCGANVPRCKLLVEGGQTGPHVITADQTQVRKPDSNVWQNLGFWCPQSQGATAVPDAATIRDQVIKLLPRVAIATTGSPATLVNLQTILWADTGTRRPLGRITVVGQPVWLRLAFAHADWSFGDGDTDTTEDPGKPYDPDTDPCAEIMCPDYYGHVYRATGHVTISLTVSWRATYSLDGTHFTAVDPDPLAGPGATHALLVRQARAVLVPDPGTD